MPSEAQHLSASLKFFKAKLIRDYKFANLDDFHRAIGIIKRFEKELENEPEAGVFNDKYHPKNEAELIELLIKSVNEL